jgi:hypothetical protein
VGAQKIVDLQYARKSQTHGERWDNVALGRNRINLEKLAYIVYKNS